MNGAESLVRTLVAGGVDVCFTNPGTSEMHFVAALDRVEGMRCVLGLFEGVVTGAADGYFRMKGTPASTLLHLGPGLANGLANLHNAKKAHSGIVNIVGQHATYHIGYNAPLTSDIEGLARPMSEWVRTSPDAKSVAADGAAAIAAAKSAPPQIATLILPADTAWNEADGIATVAAPKQQPGFSADAVEKAAKTLHSGGSQNLLLITGNALTERGLALAQQIAGKTGCKVMGQTYHPRMARGRGRFSIDRIPYVIEQALPLLKDFKNIVLVEANDPIAFFAYPNKPSHLKPEGCELHRPCAAWRRERGGRCFGRAQRTRSAPTARSRTGRPRALARTQQAHRRLDSRPTRSPRRLRARSCPRALIVIRRGHHHRPRLLPAERRPAAPRHDSLTLTERGRLDRLRHAGGHRRRPRLPRPPRLLHGRRRQRDVHDPVAVDAGSRSRHDDHLRQQQLRDPGRPNTPTWARARRAHARCR